jgi:outer membrane protein OmpA-like peptidoglycan-associated protein/Tfp pilus assembly protein PilF
MKRTLFAVITLITVLAINPAFAKKGKVLLEKGDHYYKLFMFDKAAKYYKKYYAKNTNDFYVTNRLADMYRVRGNYADAAEWYSKAVTLEGATPQTQYNYAFCLRNVGNYDEALKQFQRYAEQNPSDNRGAKIAGGLAELKQFFKDSSRYYIKNVQELNTDKADYSPAWFKNKALGYVSAGQKGKIDQRWSGQIFYDIYFADYDTINKTFGKGNIFEGKVESDYHEGPMTFDSSFTKIIFTRNNVIKKTKESDEGIIMLNLFESKFADGKWGKVTRLPFNSPDFSSGHPTLSKNGKILIFASDREGGRGGQDLYYVEYKAEAWGEPVNLGPEINTEGDEVFPYLHPDGTLFYASDGMPGLGGLDVYSAKKTGETHWTEPKNIGAPINTNFDDFGLIYDKEMKYGYFTSNRPGGKGDDDIYYFDNQHFKIKIVVYDKLTNENIAEATVKVVEKTDTIYRLKTDKDGRTTAKVQFGNTFVLKASKEGYRSNTVTINTNEIDANQDIRIPLMQGYILEALVVDKTTQKPIDAADVFADSEKAGKVPGKTDASGKAYLNVKAGQIYKATADKFGYFLVSAKTVSTIDIPENQDTIKVTLELSFLSAGAIVKLENIYYDFDKYNIRKDAAEELDRLVEIMNKYPKMKIEMRSHTDSRGSDSYNMTLSSNRAKSAAKYIVKEGINQSRIVYKGYGETVPVNGCTNGVPCSEEDHQLNRRTEFKVLVQPDGTEVKGSIQ